MAMPAAVGTAVLAFVAPAHANLTIIPIYNAVAADASPGAVPVSSDPNAAVIEATISSDITALETYIANPITISINFEEVPTGLADSNSNAFYNPSYSSYVNALNTHQILSAVDNKAIASLGAVTATNPVNANANIVTNGNLLTALGYSSLTTGGFVEFNAGIVNDSRVSPAVGKYDLQSAVAHELDEVLGIGGAGSQLNSVATGFGGATPTSAVGPLDLFRYSAPGVRSYSTSGTVSSYFSVDGGNTDLVHFNQNGAADSSDFSDWGDGVAPADGEPNTPPQVQDAYGGPYDGTPDTFANLGANELTALDAVGWNLTPAGTAVETGAVPEPASLGVITIGAVGLLARRRRIASK
jgi:hypothetical protein